MSKDVFIFRTYEEGGVLTDSTKNKKYNLLILPSGSFVFDTERKTITYSTEYSEETIKLEGYGASNTDFFEKGSTKAYMEYMEDELEFEEAASYEDFFNTDDKVFIGADKMLAIVINNSGFKYIYNTPKGITSYLFQDPLPDIPTAAALTVTMFTYERE